MTVVLAQQILLGLLLGGLYGLAAAGLSLVFGVLRVLNVAHGELIMLGGYGAFWLFALLGWDPFASLLVVIPGSLLLGALLYLGLFGFVVRAPEETRIKNSLLVGFGLALSLHALAVRLWTADDRSITTAYGGPVVTLGSLTIPLIRLLSLLVALALIVGLHLLLARWRWGKAIRAAAKGERYLDPALEYRDEPGTAMPRPRRTITEREREILRLTAVGHGNKEIASQLGISIKTVEVHKANAMRKLDLAGRADVVRYAVVQGWMKDP